MVKERFRVQEVKSFTPAIDARNEDAVYALGGKNYFFDSKGPKSGFGTRLLAEGQVIEGEDGVAQSIEIGNQSFVFTVDYIWQLSEDGTQWDQILDLTDFKQTVIDPWRKKWTGAYLANGVYFAHYDYGFFKYEFGELIEINQDNTPGVPYGPMAVAETNGRLIVLGRKYVTWSAPGSPENFTPQLGGAGQQLLSDRVSGLPMTLSAFETGFEVWTSEACLLAEFIGGDTVFRFDTMKTRQLPLNPWCVNDLPDGTQLLCTKQGLFRSVNGNEPEILTPVFNEFFRHVLTHENFVQVRIEYIMELDLLYVQLRDYTNHYVRTYVLAVALDKWGTFDERHLGIIRYRAERGSWGYVDNEGVAHKFVEYTFNREVEPGVYEGLDSEITFGYIKPPQLHFEIDSLLEMHELFLGDDARPSWSQPTIIDLGDVPTPPAENVCLDFVSETYLSGGQEEDVVNLVDGYNAAYLVAGGYLVGAPASDNPSLTMAYNTDTFNALYNDDGFSLLIEIDIGNPSDNFWGSLVFFNGFGVDPHTIDVGIDFTDFFPAPVIFFNATGSGVYLEVPATGLSGLIRVAITVDKDNGDGTWHSSISVNGGVPVTDDVASKDALTPLILSGYVTALGGDPSFLGNTLLTEQCTLQRFCTFPSVDDAELQSISGTGENLPPFGA